MSHTGNSFKTLGKSLVNVGKDFLNILPSIKNDICQHIELKKKFKAFCEAEKASADTTAEPSTRTRDEN